MQRRKQKGQYTSGEASAWTTQNSPGASMDGKTTCGQNEQCKEEQSVYLKLAHTERNAVIADGLNSLNHILDRLLDLLESENLDNAAMTDRIRGEDRPQREEAVSGGSVPAFGTCGSDPVV
jgi:hypothetical protein